MGVMTTLAVSRVVALAALAHVEYGHLSDEQIEERLDAAVASGLYNVSIHGTTCEDDAAQLGRSVGLDLDNVR